MTNISLKAIIIQCLGLVLALFAISTLPGLLLPSKTAIAGCDATCWACCGPCSPCGAIFCADPKNSGCNVECASACGSSSSSSSSSSTSSGGCSNSVTCGNPGGGIGYHYLSSSGYGGAGQTGMPNAVQTKAIHTYVSNTNTCSPKWPTWSNIGGQDDIVWHDKSGQNSSTDMYSLIPMTQGTHPIDWSDARIVVHQYVNSNALYCSGFSVYRCYGAFSVSSGAYSKSTGDSIFQNMTVSGTATFTQKGGQLIVAGLANCP